MKIGLLTFHSAHNYGAVLQAYATQETLKNLGYDIEVINYCPDYLVKQRIFPSLKKVPLILALKLVVEGVICLIWRYKRRKGFLDFIQSKLILSEKNYGNVQFGSNENYDVYVMGSDQIWNIKLTSGFDNAYWGNFKTKRNAKIISYAASMSNYSLSEDDKSNANRLLSNFHAISVREDDLKHFLHDNFKILSSTVLDPTFLLDKFKWRAISKKPQFTKKFVLVYTIDLIDDVVRIANSIAKQLDALVIMLTTGVDKNVFVNKYQSASPEDFLGFFDNAECILTSSFHGTAFSIIFNKPFYSIAHGNDKDTRQKTILEKIGLLDRFISRDSNPDFKSIDYEVVNERLEGLRNESIDFLSSNLNV